MSRYKKSEVAYQEAVQLMPGGVNSPVRSFKSVEQAPIFLIGVTVLKLLIWIRMNILITS